MKKVIQFLRESRAELRKVSWPNWEDVSRSTTIVFFVVIVFTIFIYVVDKIISLLMELLLTGG
ncbi:MAG: preprotein translocase subunit SecE [Leptospiraceae bacterium]|nr:preprotein translocase subunit SecE [Leptospiraceae bacterium]MDW8305572.1 preprotein translocase subunit SecE [Leptospiraceae bacterium]